MGKSKSKRRAKVSSPRSNSKVSDHAKLKIKELLKQQGIRKPTKTFIAATPTNGKPIKSKSNLVKSKAPLKENIPNGPPVTSYLNSKTSVKTEASDSHATAKNGSRKTNGSVKLLPSTKKSNTIRNGKSKAEPLQTKPAKVLENKKQTISTKNVVINPKRPHKISGSTSHFLVSDCTPSINHSSGKPVENTVLPKQKKTAKVVSAPPAKTKKRKRQNGITSKNKKQKLLVPNTTLPTVASNSDSESESYIDRFFSGEDNESIVSDEDTQINVAKEESTTKPPYSSKEDEETENGIRECFHDQCDGHFSDYEDYSAEEVETDGESIEFSSSSCSDNESTEQIPSKAKDQNNGMELVAYSDRHSQEEDLTTSDDESCIYFGSNDSYNTENDSVPDESDNSLDDWSSFDSEDESSMEGSSFDDFDMDDSFTDTTDESQSHYHEFLSGRASDDPDDKEYTNDDYLFISRGGAKVYGLENNEVSFNSEDDGPQIIEVTSSRHTTGYSSDDSCPELVPIDRIVDLSKDTKPALVVTVEENHTFLECPIFLDQSNDISDDEYHNISIQDIMLRSHTIVSTVESRLSENMEIIEEAIIPKIVPVEVPLSKVSEAEIEENTEILEQTQDLQNTTTFEDEEEDVDPIIRPRFYNSLNSRQVLLLLKSSLHFHGILNIKLLAGKAEVYGYELKPNEPMTAYSPRGHSFINITPSMPAATDTIENAGKILEIFRTDFLLSDICEALHQYDPFKDAILIIERGDTGSKAFNMIDKYMKQTVFPNAQAFNNRRPYYAAEAILHCQFLLRPRTQLVSSSQWMSVSVKPTSRIMVIGGKGVGKSTLVRHLVNRNLPKHPRILLIDLDIGQPELFTPQTVSATCLNEPILGPGYMKHRVPDQAYLFGDINVVLSPIKYIKCVLRLIRHCQNKAEYQDIPWIVNTMGYNRGFGLELTVAALKALEPTDLIQITGHRSADNFDRVLSCDEVNGFKFNIFQDEVNAIGDTTECRYETHTYGSMARRSGERTNEWDMSAKDSRFAMILAHLGNALIGSSEWITDVKPCCASLNDLKVITTNDDHIDDDLVANLINANLVYLCRTNDEQVEIIECFGIGIVRCVDRVTNKVYLLPTIPLDKMAQVNVLAICNIPLPTSFLMNRSNRVQGLVPYVYKTDDFVGSKQIVQITYRPERFTQNKHNNPLK